MSEESYLTTLYEKLAEEEDAKLRKDQAAAGERITDAFQLSDALAGAFDRLAGSNEKVLPLNTHIGLAIKKGGFRERKATKARMSPHEEIERGLELCESPIEKLFLPWLVTADYGLNIDNYPAVVFNHKTDKVLPLADLVIAPQLAFVRYRADFALIARAKKRQQIFIVECDGEQFHTAARDRDRDNLFLSFGIPTFRVRGSEITSRPDKMAARIAQIVGVWAENETDPARAA